mmetsp:Transcript_3100/g.9011  ORF Transcript_3100/g.9011 Transcript_3100/m.9011 type:complete len:204 (+) Transcript_3100:457-1068(+)
MLRTLQGSFPRCHQQVNCTPASSLRPGRYPCQTFVASSRVPRPPGHAWHLNWLDHNPLTRDQTLNFASRQALTWKRELRRRLLSPTQECRRASRSRWLRQRSAGPSELWRDVSLLMQTFGPKVSHCRLRLHRRPTTQNPSSTQRPRGAGALHPPHPPLAHQQSKRSSSWAYSRHSSYAVGNTQNPICWLLHRTRIPRWRNGCR